MSKQEKRASGLEVMAAFQQKFRAEQKNELAVLDSFAQRRDELLESFQRVSSLDALSREQAAMNKFLSLAEEQVALFRYFPERMTRAIEFAQPLLLETLRTARARIASEHQQQARQETARREQQAASETRRAKIRNTYEEIDRIRAGIAASEREATDRRHEMWRRAQYPNCHCPACGRSKLLAHTYCFGCYPQRGFRSFL